MSKNEDGRPLSGILEDTIANIQAIIQSEVRLAKAEIQEERIKAGKPAGIAVSGAPLALYAVGFLVLGCFIALEIAIAPWLAALIVTVVVSSIAAALFNFGMKRMKRVDPRPTRLFVPSRRISNGRKIKPDNTRDRGDTHAIRVESAGAGEQGEAACRLVPAVRKEVLQP